MAAAQEPEKPKEKEGPWLRTGFICPACGHKWEASSHFSTVGLVCPECKNSDPDFNWLQKAMEAKEKTG
jgi:rubrerythrin